MAEASVRPVAVLPERVILFDPKELRAQWRQRIRKEDIEGRKEKWRW